MSQPSLPIDAHLPHILGSLRKRRPVVLVAEPGAGKTTRVPRAMLAEALYPSGEIWVLQPRRLAARLAAERVAEELGESVGKRVGYQVRFEERVSRETRIRFVTEGILTRRLSSGDLGGIAAVVLDEFHERSLHADFAVACLRRLRIDQPQLGLVVMSATMDAEAVAGFLHADIHQVPGRQFPVTVDYAEGPSGWPLERQVARALGQLLAEGGGGPPVQDVLVFLPGAAEIRRAREACQGICQRTGRELHLLHGDLPEREQNQAVRPGARPKVILSTNIAETSLTLPGVTAVIDSGLARVAGHSPFSGLPTLNTEPVSQAAAIQRAGRAGRVAPGQFVRLYSEHDFKARPTHDRPEVMRADLSEWCLHLSAVLKQATAADLLLPPTPSALGSAYGLLRDLGAVVPESVRGDQGELPGPLPVLSPLGAQMLRMPLHPRCSRLLIEAEARGVGRAGALLVAVLAERDMSLGARARFGEQRNDVEVGPSDLLARIDLFTRLEAANFDASVARNEQADAQAARQVARAYRRYSRHLRTPGALPDEADETALGLAILAAFPDRVAKRRRAGAAEVVFARGGAAQLAEESVVKDAEFMVVVDAAEQSGQKRGVRARMASAIEPEWLLDLFPEHVETRTETRFNPQLGRVDAHHSLRFFGLVLDESRAEATPEELAEALFTAAREQGLPQVFEVEAAERLLARWAYAARTGHLPEPPEDALAQLCRLACDGARSLDDLRRRQLTDYVSVLLGPVEARRLAEVAPSHIVLPSGRQLEVNYGADRPPFVASRLQDFFGMTEGPRLPSEALVLHLLAPNQRPVQVTSDLSGFWARHYPELKKALSRRYPKHSFPEDPRTAQPPAPRPPRRR